MGSEARVAVAIAFATTTACSLVVDLGGYVGGGAGAGSDAATSSTDGSTDRDGAGGPGVDGGVPTDGGASDGGGTTFFDDFARPNGSPGNGWVVDPNAHVAIANQRLVFTIDAPDFSVDRIYRPMAEATRDVEASVLFTLSALSPGIPQLWVRNPDTSSTEGYSVYIPDDPSRFVLFRQRNGVQDDLRSIPLAANVGVGVSYRLRIRATGAMPVILEGWLEQATVGGFTVLGHDTFSDGTAKRFDQPGTVSLATHGNRNVSYDDFTRTSF